MRVGVDIGGTFTDFVCIDEGFFYLTKVRSTPEDYMKAITDCLRSLSHAGKIVPSTVSELIHATTIATNVIIERKGPRVALLTTQGFRDVLELRRLKIGKLYDLFWEKPRPLARRGLVKGITERIDSKGNIVTPLDVDQVASEVKDLSDKGVQVLAVSLLNSYVNNRHEVEIKQIVKRTAKEMVCSISTDILPEIKEYERASTTVVNAYLIPVVSRYLSGFRQNLEQVGIRSPVFVMQSTGGITTPEDASSQPVRIIEGGPAAGVLAAKALANEMALQNVVSFDMGGTTAKACLIAGEIKEVTEYTVGGGMNVRSRVFGSDGFHIAVPSVDLVEIGQGGGSIVTVDNQGVLSVGPRSAGAYPGPVCYAQGGRQVTVTDANVVLGYISPTARFGNVVIDSSRAVKACEEIAVATSLSVHEFAYGVHQIANTEMGAAIKAVTIEVGLNPKEFALIAFGAAAPLHAAMMARNLGMKRVIVPPSAGVFSAVGLLLGNMRHDYVRSILGEISDEDILPKINATLAELRARARSQMQSEGVSDHQVELRTFLELRYHGQTGTISTPLPEGTLSPELVTPITDRFSTLHEELFGYRTDEAVQIVNVKLRSHAQGKKPLFAEMWSNFRQQLGHRPPEAAFRNVYFGPKLGFKETKIVSNRIWLGNARHKGPIIIEDSDATTVVPPDCSVSLDANGSLLLEVTN